VVVVECEGDPVTDAIRLLQPGLPTETLRAFDGELHGKGLKFGPGKVVMLMWKAGQSRMIS